MNKSIKAAIKNVAAFGDTDIFPYSFEQHIFHDRPDLLQKALEELHNDFDNQLAQNPPQNINTLATVGFTGFRWATQIDPVWNAYYLAPQLLFRRCARIENFMRAQNGRSEFAKHRHTPSPHLLCAEL